MEKIRRKYGGLGKPGTGIYYDIGSGTGKPVFAAVLMHAFERATGIEILSSLHNAALKTLEFWNENIVAGSTKLKATKAIDAPSPLVAPECVTTKIDFINGDITKCVVPKLSPLGIVCGIRHSLLVCVYVRLSARMSANVVGMRRISAMQRCFLLIQRLYIFYSCSAVHVFF